MYHIRPVAGLFDDLLVPFAVEEIVFLAQEMENREMENADAEITIGQILICLGSWFISAKQAYLVSQPTKSGNEMLC